MNSRFEQLIVGAVAAGALTLAGCSSSSSSSNAKDTGGGGGGEPEPTETGVAFLGGRVVAADQIKLYFSDAVQVPDSATVAGLFTLYGNDFAASLAYTGPGVECIGHSSIESGSVWFYRCHVPAGSITYYSTITNTHLEVVYRADNGDVLAGIAAVEVSADDPTALIVTTDAPIPAESDGGTGVLRLAYAGGTDGITDSAGDYFPEASLDDLVGNVAVAGPVFVAARTIDSTHLELVYSSPIALTADNPAAAVAKFTLKGGCFRQNSAADYYSTFSGPQQSGFWQNLNVHNVERINTAYFGGINSFQSGSDPREYVPYVTTVSVSETSPNKLVLTLNDAIPTRADQDGYLRLSYTAENGGTDGQVIASDGGVVAPDLSLGPGHRGNVRDKIGVDGGHLCSF